MNIFRIISLSVLSLLLFVSLCFFGIVYSLNKTAFNTDYLNKTVNPVRLIQVVTSSMPNGRTDEGIPGELRVSFLKTLKNNELLVNTRMIYAMKEIKHYLLDDGSLPNLHGILDDSLLNKIFVTDLIKNIEMPALVDRLFSQNIISGKDQSDTDKNAIRRAILQTESRLKHELVNAADQTVRYLLSKTSDFRLRATAKKTFLRSDIIHQFINNIDLFSLGVDILPHELHQLPGDIQLSDDQIRSVVHALEPTIRTSLVTASTDIADYLAGETSDFSASFTITRGQGGIRRATEGKGHRRI